MYMSTPDNVLGTSLMFNHEGVTNREDYPIVDFIFPSPELFGSDLILHPEFSQDRDPKVIVLRPQYLKYVNGGGDHLEVSVGETGLTSVTYKFPAIPNKRNETGQRSAMLFTCDDNPVGHPGQGYLAGQLSLPGCGLPIDVSIGARRFGDEIHAEMDFGNWPYNSYEPGELAEHVLRSIHALRTDVESNVRSLI